MQPFEPRVPKGFVVAADKLYPDIYQAVQHLLRDDFFVVNIGANDGVDNDPIHPFLLMHPHWRGIFVEPVPYNFAQLEYNLKRFPGIALVQAAICDRQQPMYYIDERAGCDMRWTSQICSFDKSYVEQSLAGLRLLAPGSVSDNAEQCIVTDHSINCMSLEQLLCDQGVDHVDFLNVDVEGMDFELIMQWDFARYAPLVMCVETACFSALERREFDRLMTAGSYQRVGEFELFSEFFIKSPD